MNMTPTRDNFITLLFIFVLWENFAKPGPCFADYTGLSLASSLTNLVQLIRSCIAPEMPTMVLQSVNLRIFKNKQV